MSSWRTWLARLGVAGTLAIVVGCGSGDVPDPSAAGDPSAGGGAPPPVPVAAQAPEAPGPAAAPGAPAEPAVAENAPESAPEGEPGAPETAADNAEAGTEGGTEADVVAGGAPAKNSATAEMLALASESQPAPEEKKQGAGGAGMMGSMMMGGTGPGGMMMSGPNPGAMSMQNQMQSSMQAQMQMRNQPGMAAMMAGMPGANRNRDGGAGGGGKDKAPNYHDPKKTVQAFLDALKDKDLELLSEATALHAEVEASVKNRNLFKRIYDGSLSEAEFDRLSDLLDGYKVSSMNVPRSTGRIQVVISKSDKKTRAMLKRHITVRHEKKGWGVCDISSAIVFKSPGMLRKKQATFRGSNR